MGNQDLSPFERDILSKLWKHYKNFRSTTIPPPEDKAQLPIIPTECIQDTQLKTYLTNFLKFVWMPALGDTSHCVFLDLCIWDPFRNESPRNWALVNPEPDEDYDTSETRAEREKFKAEREEVKAEREKMLRALKTYFEVLEGKQFVAYDVRTSGLQEVFDAETLKKDGAVVVLDKNGKKVVVSRDYKDDYGEDKIVYDPEADDGTKQRSEINTFYLLYKSLKKDFLVIDLKSPSSALASEGKGLRPTERVVTSKSPKFIGGKMPTYIERVGTQTNLTEFYKHLGLDKEEGNKKLTELNNVVDAHLAFAPEDPLQDRHVYYVPSLFYPKESGTGIGGLILISTWTFSEEALSNFQTILDSILSKIGVYYLFDNFYDQSVRSAISSIMARNMSHNIGSHVIPRATVSAVRRRLLELDLWPEDDKELTLVSSLKGALDEYTQRKSDFLAEITTEPLMTTRPAFFYREIILPLVENTLLMDNIAANEGISYREGGETNRLKLRVFINDESPKPLELKAVYKCRECEKDRRRTFHTYPRNLPYSLTCRHHKTARLEFKKVINGDHDVEVELPGPLGEFALYSFLENYIRNVAKHNKSCFRDGADMEISIKLTNQEEDYYYVEIWNNLIDPEQEVTSADGKTISLHETLSSHIKSKIIQPDGSLKRQAWGIGEMKICAVLLGGPKDFVSAVQGERSTLVKAQSKESLRLRRDASPLTVSSVEIDGRRCLVYGFYLMKSKKMCAVLPAWPDDDEGEARITQLRKEGIWIYRSLQSLKDGLSGGESIASFRFALFDCSDTASDEGRRLLDELSFDGRGDKPRLLPKFPFRILALTGASRDAGVGFPKSVWSVAQDFVTSGLVEMSSGEMLQWAWREWMRRWLGSGADAKTAVVNIFLEQRGEEEPTSRWAERACLFNQRSSEIKLRVYEVGTANSTIPRDLCGVPDGERSVHLIYDRHRGLRNVFEHHMEHSRDWSYAVLEKHSPDFAMLFSPKFPTEPDAHWTLPWELAEAGLLKVLVIDERAAEFSLEKLCGETEEVLHVLLRKLSPRPAEVKEALKWHLAWAAKIYVCTHFGVEQEPQELHDAIKKRGDSPPYLKVGVGRERIDFRLSVAGRVERSLDVDAVLIHQGILDEFGSEKKGRLTQSELLERLKSHFPFVVVESGRGIPPNLSDNEKFLPFSLLQHSVLGESVGKFGLTRILMSLARRRERSRS